MKLVSKKIKTIQARIPRTMYNDVLRFQKKLQKEHDETFGRRRQTITFSIAANKLWLNTKRQARGTSVGGFL